MKTTIDLPNDLLRKLKLRAVHDGRKLKDVAADLLRDGLAAPSALKRASQPAIRKDKKTGLQVIQCRATPSRNQQLTADRVAQILIEQESDWTGGQSS